MESFLFSKRLKPKYAIDIPLKEVDPKVSGETFCVISKSWGQTFINRYNKYPTLFMFYPYSLIRRASIAFTTHMIYDIGLAFIIIGNMVDLVAPNTLPIVFERITMLFYVTEAIHQSISRGFVGGTYSYLRNPWMCFDFMITILSMYNVNPSRKKRIEGLQPFRGLRILEIVTKIPGVGILVKGLVLSLTQMMSVTSVIFMFLVSVAITAKHIFKGILYNKCVRILPPSFPENNITYFEFIQNENNWFLDKHGHFQICGNITGAQYCNENFTCLPDIGSTPFENISNFDDFGRSMLNSLRLISTDAWDMLLDDVNAAVGPVSAFFFIPVVLLGSFYLRNLMLVVVATSFKSVVEAAKENKEILSDYSYYSYFPFDIKRLALYPLETTKETLDQVIKERSNIIDHQEAVQESWKKITTFITLKQNDIQRMQRQNDDLDFQIRKNNQDEKSYNGIVTANCCKMFHLYIKKIARSAFFENFILLVILANAAFLASVHANMSENFAQVLKIANRVFIGIFSLEFVILFLAYNINYFLNWLNVIDFIVLVIIILSEINSHLAKYSIIRTLRLISLIKLKKSWSTFREILAVTIDSLFNILRLVIMMTLVILIFAVISYHVLGPFYMNIKDSPRWSFSTFGGSAFIVLNIFTGEWIDFLFSCMELSNLSPLCPFVFIIMYVIGHLVVTSLFAALLLSSFDSVQFCNEKNRLGIFYNKMKSSIVWLFLFIETKIKENCQTRNLFSFIQFLKKTKWFVKLKQFALSNAFEGIVIFLVGYSCIVISIDAAHINAFDAPKTYMFVKISSFILTVLFLLEMIIRWIGIGIKNYFTDAWTLMDFIILIVMIVEVILLYGYDLSNAVIYLRALRSLRPLRFLNKLKGMETIVGAFVLSLPVILRVIVICLFFWLPFAILGINFFAGAFSRCVNLRGDVIEISEVTNKAECLKKNYKWENSFQNFDNIGNSYMLLFQLALFGNWADVAQLIVDYKGKNLQPTQHSSASQYAFIICFLLVGGLFSLNLFIGVAVDTFQTMLKHVEGGPTAVSLTKSQMAYYRAMRKIGRRKPVIHTEPPSNTILNTCYRINYNWGFRIISSLLICANTITIAVSSYKATKLKNNILRVFELCFIPLYCLELLIKLLGLRHHFFDDVFNIQDLCTLIAYFIGEIMQTLFKSEINLLAFLYAFRIIRVIHLLHLTEMFVSLRLLLYATIASISSLFHLILMLIVIIFIYAIIGISLFGHVKQEDYINSHSNFENVQNSMLLLFRLTTSEGWEKIYEGLSIAPPDCEPNYITHKAVISNCGNKFAAAIYLVTFIFLTNIILVNIFIAVILDNFKEAIYEEEDIFKEENLISFNKSWKKYDPKGTQFIPIEKLSIFLDELVRDLRISKPNYVAISYMNLPVTIGNKVHSLDVLQGILKVKAGVIESTETFLALQNQMQLRYEQMFPELKGSRFIGTTMDLKRRDFAARTIQKNFKKLTETKLTKIELRKRKMSQALFSNASNRRLSLKSS